MIVYDLSCDAGHRFEGWFGSSSDFDDQKARGLLTCPECASPAVDKAPMAPAVGAKGNQLPTRRIKDEAGAGASPVASGKLPPEVVKAMKKLAEVQAKALKDSKWVGKDFAEKSRAMHYGEADNESIHGEATLEEAQDLLDEGIAVAPLPFPVSPPEDLN